MKLEGRIREGLGDWGLHVLAMCIAIFGPLVNFWVKPLYAPFIPGPFVYWGIMLASYTAVLAAFVRKRFPDAILTVVRLIILGVFVEDFFSNLWYALLQGRPFLPFFNWYGQYFPFFDVIGKPTPFLIVPQWYILAFAAYLCLTLIQYESTIRRRMGRERV